MPRESVDLLLRYYSIEPFGDPWRQTAEIVAAVLNSAGLLDRNQKPIHVDPEDIVPIHPPGWQPKSARRVTLSASESAARSRAAAGF
ncbi:hypothetical protein [Rosistilla oblonga]|uniref:Uncharacterized protein n=1 Tax=Rosistilla oblonga TaxID=2527990 RepID=A0A518ITV7_9BACT|nr:hypothetical protein [Rosistilla oblonga]QDV56518.1 hypothetical protein Mal33_25090 [Rosistilla oblonga]